MPAPGNRLDQRLARFHTQRVEWHGCRLDDQDEIGKELESAGARCAELIVPVDYRNPDGRTTTVAIARRPAGDRAGRLGTLMVNTGGPGESRSGISWIVHGVPPFVAGSPELFLSVATVKAYVSRMLSRLDLNNRVQVALLVHDADLI